MIDIHCHILHDIDDGPENIEESIKLSKFLYKENITKVFATPHVIDKVNEKLINTIVEKVDKLNIALKNLNIDIEIIKGAEIYIDDSTIFSKDIYSKLNLGESNYLLCEFPLMQIPKQWKKFRFDAEIAGYKMIIAHPERYENVNIEWIEEIIAQGSLVQVNSGSLNGLYGKNVQKIAIDAINNKLVHFIASDSHNISIRKPDFHKLIEKFPDINYSLLCKENPENILNNKKIETDFSSYIKKSKKNNRFFDFFKNF